MKIQCAMDFDNLDSALSLLAIIHPYVDIIEVGSPLILSEGCHAVTRIKELYPHHDVLADMKIMDGGEDISSTAFHAGADIVTILGVTNDATVEGAVKAAKRYGKKICADMMNVVNLAERTRKLEEIGVDIVAVHTAHDTLNCIGTPIDALRVIRKNLVTGKCLSAISGGITLIAIPEICEIGPDVVIVGSALTTAKDPLAVAQQLKAAIK